MSKLEDQLKQISATAGPVESDDEDLGAAEDSSAELDDEAGNAEQVVATTKIQITKN